MTLDQPTAASALAAIEQTERRTSRAISYGIASGYLILWGVVTTTGYIAQYAHPRYAGWTWLALQTIGFAATVLMVRRQRSVLTRTQHFLGWKLVAAQVALVVFGLLLITLLGPLTTRQLGAFWPLIFMLGYVLAGLWIGWFFTVCGATVAALTLIGFWWAGPWFPLWMAAANGGALILGGLWLRQKGASL